MPFNGSEGEQISLQEAQKLTANYQKNNPNGTIATFIGKNLIHKILDQKECMGMGIRIYYGQENDGEKRLVLVGAKADETDMTEGVIADRGGNCPPICDHTSPLKHRWFIIIL